jgi:transposase
MKEVYVGLDVHRNKTVYVIQGAGGEVLAEGSTATHRQGIHEMVWKHQLEPGTAVCLECGVQAGMVCDALEELEMVPVVVDAVEVRKKARRRGQKTDRRDAFEISDGLRRGIWSSIVYMPSPPIRQLRRILSRRRHFVSLSTQEINAAKFLLRLEGILAEESISLTTAAAWSELLARPQTDSVRGHMQLHARIWEVTSENIRLLEKELRIALEPFAAVMGWLTSVPGIGPITAACFIAVVGDPARFPDSNHLVSYLGLAPSMYDTGDTQRHGHITKAGSAYMRALLCEIAQQAARPAHPLNPYFVRVAAKSGYKKAAIAIAQRLARILYRMWLNREGFDVSKLNVQRDGKARTKIYHWKIRPSAQAVATAG